MYTSRRFLFAGLLTAWLIGLSLTLHAAPLQAFENDSLAHIIKQRQGKPFVLILWSLDCEYCQASLQALAQKKRQNKNLNIVTLATDSMADAQTAALIRQRLRALGMQSDTWAFGAAPAEQLRHAIDPNWHGELPRSYWFNVGGTHGTKRSYSGVLDAAIIERYIGR